MKSFAVVSDKQKTAFKDPYVLPPNYSRLSGVADENERTGYYTDGVIKVNPVVKGTLTTGPGAQFHPTVEP